MKTITIQEIENGWVIEFFSEHGKTEFDKTVFYEAFEDAKKGMDQWLKQVKE